MIKASDKEENMDFTQTEILEKLLNGFRRYYNIYPCADDPALKLPLYARCEYFAHDESYMISRKVNMWQADSEEFIYIFATKQLSEDFLEDCFRYVWEDALKKAHIGPGHMCTYATALILCERCDEPARKLVKKRRMHKSFRFSLHGWMELRAALVETGMERITANACGRDLGKSLKGLLFVG